MLCDARITRAQVAAVAGGANLTLRPGTADLMLLLKERGVRGLGRLLRGGCGLWSVAVVSITSFPAVCCGQSVSFTKTAVPNVRGRVLRRTGDVMS